MIKGDKIRLKSKMGVFDNIGEICEVTDISDDGSICFKFGNGRHLGCMSFDEYKKYFELVEEKEPIKRAWSEWKSDVAIFYNLTGECIKEEIYYRENGKCVQVKLKDESLKSSASCCKKDEFDFWTGRELAERRLIIKYLAREVKEYANSL